MSAGRVWVVAGWLAFVAACMVVAWHSRYSADMSAFLPRSPSAEQRLLVEQLKSGLASRLILVGIDGAGHRGDRQPPVGDVPIGDPGAVARRWCWLTRHTAHRRNACARSSNFAVTRRSR